MGEAAVKEPSMEDILSSIRKIISEEGGESDNKQEFEANDKASTATTVTVESDDSSQQQSTSQMSEVLTQVREASTAEDVADIAPSETPASSEDTSGGEAARMASALSAMRAQVPQDASYEADAEASLQDVVDTNSSEEQNPQQSLASIAETVIEKADTETAVEKAEIEEPASKSEIHVEMADATPAPEVETTVSSAAVETMVEEEMAFKGALMSPSANGEVAGAFDRLKRSAMDDIDAKTEAILRPMLREWLDENLPNMVERLVREEIERVARGV